jgi:Ca-activated chloride channel family protein
MFRFADPWLALLLLALPAAVYWKKRRGRQPSLAVSETASFSGIPPSFRVRTRWVVPALSATAFALLVAALCRPQWGEKKIETLTEGINIVLAVDLSGSMAAIDFKLKGEMVNRLEAVKSVVAEFIAGRDGDRIGMVVFGTNAYTQVPLTRDYNTVAFILDRLKIGAAGDQTAIGDAIGISLKRLKDIESKSNVIVLLTDGQSNAGELPPADAAAIAAERGVKIHTIGVGSSGEVPFLIQHPLFGQQYVYQQVDMDEDALKAIAAGTGGLYFKAENTEALKRIYETIDAMEKTEAKSNVYAVYNDLYPWLVVLALLLLVTRMVLENTVYLEAP